LTSLGLNLNSQDNLYKTFGSPWSNEAAKGEPDYQIPAFFCRATTTTTSKLLDILIIVASCFLILHIYICFHCVQPLHFQKFHPLTLFYIFYRYLLSLTDHPLSVTRLCII
jgi:CCR4-NOT transcription complex subunit 2